MNDSVIKGLSHIAIAINSLDEVENWVNLFSCDKKEYTSTEQGVNALVINAGFCDIEFLEPLDQSSSISGFLQKNPKGGIHHICFFVDDLEKSLAEVKSKGIRNITRKKVNGILHNSPIAFLNPKDLSNVLVEFEEITK